MNIIKVELDKDASEHLLRVLEYFKKAEEFDLKGLNEEFVPACEARLKIFSSLIHRCSVSDFKIELTEKEKFLLHRALDYYKRAEIRDIANLSYGNGSEEVIAESRKRLKIYESLLEYFDLQNYSKTWDQVLRG